MSVVDKLKTRIALFGGTFDPVHEGHLAVAKEAMERARLDRVIFLPCRQSPHKTEAAGAGEQDRLEMLELAISTLSWAEVSDWEYRQPIPSYSWKTAEAFVARYPDSELFWLMGADQWRVFESWNRADYLAELVSFLVHARDGVEVESRVGMTALRGDHPASSSRIRELLSRQEAIPEGWQSQDVAEFISRKGLYQE